MNYTNQQEFDNGAEAYADGLAESDNPNFEGSKLWELWNRGWHQAHNLNTEMATADDYD